MKQIIPEIYVKNCADALEFYRQLFGGEIKNRRMSDDLPAFRGMSGKVIHSELHVTGRCVLYFVDVFDKKRQNPGNVTIVLHFGSKREFERIYEGLRVGGHVGMEMQRTLTGAWHAIVTDRYGAPWALSFAGARVTPTRGE